MGLLQNISLRNAEPYDRFGDTSEMWLQTLVWSRNRYVGFAEFSQYYGMPVGYGSPYAWILPPIKGGMASTNGIFGTGDINYANLAGVKRAVCTIAGTSYIGVADKVHLTAIAQLTSDIVGLATVNAGIAALVKMVSDINGSGDVTAALGGISLAICNIIGEGTVNVDIAANALISSDITGTATFDSDIIASMYIVASILANAIVSGDIDADAFMTADIFVGATVDPLSPSALAASVWNALAADFNDAGSMGNKLNSAGAAADPWSVLIDGLPAGDILESIGKLTGNKVTKVGDIITIYENDGLTIWRQYNLASGGRVEI